MVAVRKIKLPGVVSQMVPLPANEVWVLVHHGGNALACVVGDDVRECIEAEAASTGSLRPRTTVRAVRDELWLGRGDVLHDVLGRRRVELSSVLYGDERMESFVVLPDGFVVSTSVPLTARAGSARVLRIDRNGLRLWSRRISPGLLEYEGVVEMRAEDGWAVKKKRPWKPKLIWNADFVGEPLIVTSTSVLAGYSDSSGIGRRYVLDLVTGQIVWASTPGPNSNAAADAAGNFLLGRQGYGAFETELRSPVGEMLQHWDSHGHPIIDGDGRIAVVEMSNASDRQHVAQFGANGDVRRGPRLPGYYTTHPVLAGDGRAAFFRAGRLFVVDAELKVAVLVEEPEHEGTAVGSRTLLLDDGRIVFGVNDELWFVETDLTPMASAPWPCGSQTAGANPAPSAG